MLLEQYRPRPRLVTKTTRVDRPKVPVIDAHNHLDDAFGGGWIKRPLAGMHEAMDAAGVTLVKGDLRGIARARQLSEATSRTIRQNLFLAFVYNAICVPLAAFGLVSPMLASAAMSLSSVSVIGNSLRLRNS